jgi:alpha-beta hydrolase superfamily lysophospholipase
MWARDLLPEKFEKAGLRGRFSTVGYNANKVNGAVTTTIESAAKDLLYQLQHDRPEGSQRPIFFVAHSLGGLVVAQVLRQSTPFFCRVLTGAGFDTGPRRRQGSTCCYRSP